MNYYQASGALVINYMPYFEKMKCKLNSSRKSVVESYMNDNLDNKISNTNPWAFKTKVFKVYDQIQNK